MLVDRGHMGFDTDYFPSQRLDALGELVLGKGAEVLPRHFHQRIGRLAWKKIVDVHGVTLTPLQQLSINRPWPRFQR